MSPQTETRPRFLALLRGVNVGGKNIVPKDALRGCFEDMGFSSVRTYIQSGNILFRSTNSDEPTLADEVERALSARFSYNARAVVLSRKSYRTAVDAAPEDWGQDDERMHHALFTLAGAVPGGHPRPAPVAERLEWETVTPGPGRDLLVGIQGAPDPVHVGEAAGVTGVSEAHRPKSQYGIQTETAVRGDLGNDP